MISLEIVCDVAPIVTCAGTFIGVMIALWYYRRSLSWKCYLYLAELYYEILRMGMKDPDFHNPEKTKNYKDWEKSDPDKFFKYAIYAQMCWAYAEDIYYVEFGKKRLRKLYAPTFKRFNELHGVWLCLNKSMFPTKFIQFVKPQGRKDDCPDD